MPAGAASADGGGGATGRWSNPRLWPMLGFGFASGLPLPLSGFTLRQWMSEGHVSLGLIGLTANIGLAYTLKFLWSPLLDRVRPGHLSGRRRGWLLIIQPILLGTTVALALSNPAHSVAVPLAIAAVVAFLSASQDSVIDAWRIESFEPAQQGYALAAYIWGYRLALLLAGAGAIALASSLGWHGALLVVSAAGLVGIATTLLAPEPAPALAPPRPAAQGWLGGLQAAYAAPLRELLGRPGAALIIAYVALFKLGEAMAGVMLPPFYRSLGFDRAAVALANGPASLAATICGFAAGGWIVARIGLGRALIATGFGQMAAMAMYLGLAALPGHHGMLVGTAVTEAFMEGLADAAFLTFLSALCNPAFTATQYALLSSIAPLASRTLGGVAGFVAAATGWTVFYAIAMAASLPAMLVMLVMLRTRRSGVDGWGVPVHDAGGR